ncbi:MAG: SurA N-terminal domain-containing protein [Nitrospinae bacterium]|nr:SurA N-terminal domain-containing protein [Nitrospinota bacterium]
MACRLRAFARRRGGVAPGGLPGVTLAGLAIGVLCIGFVLGSMGCSKPSNSVSKNSDKTVLATVNGQPISVEVFRKELKQLERKFRLEESPEFTPEQALWLKTNALNQIIRTMLFQQEAAKHEIQVSNEEFEETLMRMKNEYQDDSFQRYLDMENITRQEWENKLKNNLLIKNLINKAVNSKVSVSEGEVREYFDRHPDEFQKGDQVRALHIMLETEDEARKILKQLSAGKKDFSELAKEHSLGPEGARGGDLGYFEKGHMPEEFDDIFKLKINETSDIILTPYGYHIFRVTDKKTSQKMSFEESKKQIQGKLLREHQEKAFQEWLRKLREEASIDISNEVFAQIE